MSFFSETACAPSVASLFAFTSWVTADVPLISNTSISIFVALLLSTHRMNVLYMLTKQLQLEIGYVCYSVVFCFSSQYAPVAVALEMPILNVVLLWM